MAVFPSGRRAVGSEWTTVKRTQVVARYISSLHHLHDKQLIPGSGASYRQARVAAVNAAYSQLHASDVRNGENSIHY